MHETILLLVEILLSASLVAILARRIKIPYSTALVMAGLLISFLEFLPKTTLNSDIVLNIFLPILLFESALNTNIKHLKDNLKPIVFLSLPGVLISAFITGGLLVILLGLSWPVALLLGSMLTITDTVSVLAAFKEVKIPFRLSTIIEGESLFNDGTAIVLFRVFLAIVLTQKFNLINSISEVIIVSIGGLVIGLIIGYTASFILGQIKDHLIEIILTTTVAIGTYFLSEDLHVSGIIAVVAAGLVIGNNNWDEKLSPKSQIAIKSFWEYAGFLVNSIIFLLIGLSIDFFDIISNTSDIICAFLAFNIARIILIYGSFFFLNFREKEKIPMKWQHVFIIANIKGSLTMALAIGLPLSLINREEIISILFGVIFMSLILQGLFLKPFIKRMHLTDKMPFITELEENQARILSSRAAQDHLDVIYRAGIISKFYYEQFKARYQATIANAERKIRDLNAIYSDFCEDMSDKTQKMLYLVEKTAIINAMRQKVISDDTGEKYMEEINEKIIGKAKGDDE